MKGLLLQYAWTSGILTGLYFKYGTRVVYDASNIKAKASSYEARKLDLGCCTCIVSLSYRLFYVIIFQKFLVSPCCTHVHVRASFSSDLKGKEWCWPPARSEASVNFKSKLTMLQKKPKTDQSSKYLKLAVNQA